MGIRTTAFTAPIAAVATLAAVTRFLPSDSALFTLFELPELLAHVRALLPENQELLTMTDTPSFQEP